MSIFDALEILDRFRGQPTGPPMYRVDLVGAGPEGIDGLPDRVISVLDLLGYLNAFRGADFVASTEYAEPCP